MTLPEALFEEGPRLQRIHTHTRTHRENAETQRGEKEKEMLLPLLDPMDPDVL